MMHTVNFIRRYLYNVHPHTRISLPSVLLVTLVILVTHESDIAEYAQRRILFRDGKVVEDVPVTKRRAAA